MEQADMHAAPFLSVLNHAKGRPHLLLAGAAAVLHQPLPPLPPLLQQHQNLRCPPLAPLPHSLAALQTAQQLPTLSQPPPSAAAAAAAGAASAGVETATQYVSAWAAAAAAAAAAGAAAAPQHRPGAVAAGRDLPCHHHWLH